VAPLYWQLRRSLDFEIFLIFEVHLSQNDDVSNGFFNLSGSTSSPRVVLT